MKRLVLGVALAFIVPVSVSAFTAYNRYTVTEIGNATFEVASKGGRVGARDYWCAAGDYVIARRLPSNTRIYLVRPPGPSVTGSKRKSVQFTVDPQTAGVTPIEPRVSLTVNSPADNMSAAAAQQYCYGSSRFF